jgi:hypothetical protein
MNLWEIFHIQIITIFNSNPEVSKNFALLHSIYHKIKVSCLVSFNVQSVLLWEQDKPVRAGAAQTGCYKKSRLFQSCTWNPLVCGSLGSAVVWVLSASHMCDLLVPSVCSFCLEDECWCLPGPAPYNVKPDSSNRPCLSTLIPTQARGLIGPG